MKTLQNNFTTPEQSKRLLELGVPVVIGQGDKAYDTYGEALEAGIQKCLEIVLENK